MFGLVLLNALLISLVVFGYNNLPELMPSADPPPVPQIAGFQDQAAPAIKMIALYINQGRRQFFNCQPECQELTIPSFINDEAVTDGASWYFYQSQTDDRGDADKTLQRYWPDQNKTVTIIEQTALAKPRSLYIGPDNLKVAFWLDNIVSAKKSLTELWIYNSLQGGTKVVAEKLNQNDILTRPRWNQAGNFIWFLGNKDNPKLHLAAIQPPSLAARFNNLDWSDMEALVDGGPMDINFTGRSLAFAQASTGFITGNRTLFGRNKLVIVNENDKPRTSYVKSPIVYLRWMLDDSLLYLTQDKQGFTIWRQSGTVHKLLARYSGQITSLKMDPTGKYLVLLTSDQTQVTALTFAVDSRRFVARQTLPPADDAVYLINVEVINDSLPGQSISVELSDDQITAFIGSNLVNITTVTDAKPLSILITDQPNTIFLDFAEPGRPKQRLLLTINDAVQSEWTILSKYIAQGGDWIKTYTGISSDPAPLKLYDWETSLNQWILKETY